MHVKRFESRSGPKFCRARSGHKMFQIILADTGS